MAGGYKHIIDDNGKFRGIELLDNLGDAYEALEECYLMIQWLTSGNKRKIYEAWLKGYLKKKCPENVGSASYKQFWN